MGLLACMAFSPQPALAEPDTGPQTVNEVFSNTSASADLDKVQQQGVFEISNTYNLSAFGQANGQETDVFRSDHTVANNVYLLNYGNDLLDVKNKLVINDSDDPVLVVRPERRTCESNVMKDRYNYDRSSKYDLATAAALHSRQMVWVMKRPAWKYYYQRC